jgi:hypothetical protein
MVLRLNPLSASPHTVTTPAFAAELPMMASANASPLSFDFIYISW